RGGGAPQNEFRRIRHAEHRPALTPKRFARAFCLIKVGARGAPRSACSGSIIGRCRFPAAGSWVFAESRRERECGCIATSLEIAVWSPHISSIASYSGLTVRPIVRRTH